MVEIYGHSIELSKGKREKLRTVSWSGGESRSRVSTDPAQINRVPGDPTGRSMVWHVQSIGLPEAISRVHSPCSPRVSQHVARLTKSNELPAGKKMPRSNETCDVGGRDNVINVDRAEF